MTRLSFLLKALQQELTEYCDFCIELTDEALIGWLISELEQSQGGEEEDQRGLSRMEKNQGAREKKAGAVQKRQCSKSKMPSTPFDAAKFELPLEDGEGAGEGEEFNNTFSESADARSAKAVNIPEIIGYWIPKNIDDISYPGNSRILDFQKYRRYIVSKV